MAINLTNPMTGDAFKTEIENALDKRGDIMDDGATLTLGKNPEGDMDAVPKKYFDDLVYYLNNISPLSVKRDDSGQIVWSSENILCEGTDYLVPDGKEEGAIKIYIGSSPHFTNVFTIPQLEVGYTPPIRRIDVDLRVETVRWPYSLVTVYIVVKDESGNEFKKLGTTRYLEGSTPHSFDFNFDIPLSCESYSIDYIVTTEKSNSNSEAYLYLKLYEVSERYQLRDIIEY